MTDILCPTCGTDDTITGERHGDLIRLTCATCGLVWDRDPSPRCATCGSTSVEGVAQAAWDKSRGTQLSVSYLKVVYLCTVCDADLLRRQRQTNSPLPPDEHPAASGH
jgi:hypothetical protein